MELTATPWDESSIACDCCGNNSKTIWGGISSTEAAKAAYYVQWTVDSPDHYPNIDLIIGPWGDGSRSEERVLVAIAYRPGPDGGSFMVIDGANRPANTPDLCGRALTRAEVIGTPLAQEAFELLDAIWLCDPRIAEVANLAKMQ
jgi:hypothetical protein